MALFYYRFRIFGLKPTYALTFKDLKLYTPKDCRDDCIIETTRRTENINKIEKKVLRFLELLRIFYLKWINYYRIDRRRNKHEKWEFCERISAANIVTKGLLPFYGKRNIHNFLTLTLHKTRFADRIRIANTLLIAARIPNFLFEARFLLRWMALESLVNAEDIKKKPHSKKKYSQLKKDWNKFATNIKSEKIRSIIENNINNTIYDLTFREKFEKLIKIRKLPIIYDDIETSKKIRDKIVHTGSISELKYSMNYCHKSSMVLEALVRNILMYYLGLKFDPDWKIWYAWTVWKPQKR